MKKEKKSNVKSIVAALVGTALALLTVLYVGGYFDFSFIKRPEKKTETTVPVTSVATTAETEAVDPVEREGNDKKYNAFISSLTGYSDAASEGKWTTARRDYTPGHDSIYLVNREDLGNLSSLPFAERWGQVRAVNRTVDEKTGVSKTTESTEGGDIPLLSVYGGYIIYEGKDARRLYSTAGYLLVENLGDITPAYMRDKSGNALFLSGSKYVRLTESGFVDAETDGCEGASLRIDSFNYRVAENLPSLYGVNEERTVVTNLTDVAYNSAQRQKLRDAGYSESDLDNVLPPAEIYTERKAETRYGYKKGEEDTGDIYTRAFPFSSVGAATVADGLGRLTVIGEDYRTVIDPSDNELRLDGIYERVVDGWSLPDTYGEESLGMLTFDSLGWMRVRRTMLYKYDRDYVAREEDCLVNYKGEYFEIPNKFTLEGYSCGVLLLKRDNRYGFMTVDGKFIVDPDCVSASPFYGGLAVVSYGTGRWGMVDKEGNTVLPPVFDYISNNSSGVITAYRAGSGWTVFNVMGN